MSDDSVSSWRTSDGRPVVIRRSARRQRTVSAFWEGGHVVVAIPAKFSERQVRHWVPAMLKRLESSGGVGDARAENDAELYERARRLSARYLHGRAEPNSVRWSARQNKRWGSASPASKKIRLSTHLRGMPDWVVDYVLLHELAHLLVADHGPRFWELLAPYPRLAEARAFLSGVTFATNRGLPAVDGDNHDLDADDLDADDVAQTESEKRLAGDA